MFLFDAKVKEKIIIIKKKIIIIIINLQNI